MIPHGIIGIILCAAHGIFLFRGRYLWKNRMEPRQIDKAVLFLSHILLPVVFVTGVIGFTQSVNLSIVMAIHGIIGILPIIMIFTLQFMKSFKKKHPFFLPTLNFVLIAAALITGFLLGRI